MSANVNPTEGDLRVWWIPQVPMKPFQAPVKDIQQAKLLLRTLADYDLFQYQNRVKDDYSNAGGLEIFDGTEWLEWDDPETGDDIDGVMREEDIAAETPMSDANAKTVTLPLVWEDRSSNQSDLYLGPLRVGYVMRSTSSDPAWCGFPTGNAPNPTECFPDRASAQQALEDAVLAMGVETYLRPLSEHTKRLTAWMRKRAEDAPIATESGRGWHHALTEIANEIEANEAEQCGHAQPSPDVADAVRLKREIARIADDYHPDSDREAPLALQEMRDALMGLLDAAMAREGGDVG